MDQNPSLTANPAAPDQEEEQSAAAAEPEYDDFQVKFLRLPGYAQDWICSPEVAKNNSAICQKFNLPPDKNVYLAAATLQVVFKEFLLEKLPEVIARDIGVGGVLAKQIAVELALKQLLPIREHLAGLESLIRQWGGVLPAVLPPKPQAKTSVEPLIKPFAQTAASTVSKPAPAPSTIQKAFREAAQENKEILNQHLTSSPIKIADFDQPVRPTIKNWLADYIKQKGARRHDEMERGDYLFNSPNVKGLSEGERAKLSEVLKTYDENLTVPIFPDTKLIDLNNLAKKETPAPRAAAPQPPPQKIPTPASAGNARAADSYREPVSREDLTGPQKPTPKPAPRIEGNIIDLSNHQ